MTEAASGLAAELGSDSRFVTADVYDAVRRLGADGFDIVYTGVGSLCWLPDAARWAEVVAALLRPGGFVHLAEFHPFADTLDDEEGSVVHGDYFASEPEVYEDSGSYTDRGAATIHNRAVEWTARPGRGRHRIGRCGIANGVSARVAGDHVPAFRRAGRAF